MRKVILSGVVLASLLSGCASPEVIAVSNPGDDSMTCAQLKDEIEKLDKARRDLSSEKGVTGKNVAAALFFWPALIATHSNVNESLRAVNDRRDRLTKIFESKRCMAAGF